MAGRNISYGRGGAGNISRQQSSRTPSDLVTPTIKQEVYTTGRGGSGNMVLNDPQRPEIARESQDVDSPPLRAQQQTYHHTGRGGAANYTAPEEEEKAAQEIQREEAELMRVRTQDRARELEQERQEQQEQNQPSA